MRLAFTSHRDHLHAFQRIYQYPLVLREFILEEILQKIIELFRVINDSAEIREILQFFVGAVARLNVIRVIKTANNLPAIL